MKSLFFYSLGLFFFSFGLFSAIISFNPFAILIAIGGAGLAVMELAK